jgi:DNA-binding response OmpR family regulator
MVKKILIIEDEKILAEMYRDKFTQVGFKVILAYSAEEALKILGKEKKEKPDLILLDILLPRENGITFLKKIKKDSKISSIPVIAFSNYDDPDTKNQAFQLGVKDYLIKTSYTPNEIVAKVKQLLSEG